MIDARLIGEIVGQTKGPALVIGGGPTALEDLATLHASTFQPAAVLSANEHGYRQSFFAIDYAVCCDGRHGEKHIAMERLLRQVCADARKGDGALDHDCRIVTPGHFGDYRLPEWTLGANSGLTAIAVAVLLGCAPVVVVGIDFYRWGNPKAGTYFHDPNGVSNSNTKRPVNFTSQLAALERCIGARAPVRAMRGKLLDYFPRYDPHERVAPAMPPRGRYLRSLPTCVVQCRPHPLFSFKLMNVEPGRVFPVSPNEARGAIVGRGVKLIETWPAPDGSPLRLPVELTRSPRGYTPALARRDIGR